MADRLPLPHVLAAIIQPKLNCSLGYELPSIDVRVMSALPRMAKILKLQESRVVIPSRRGLAACRPLGFFGAIKGAHRGSAGKRGTRGVT